MAKPLLQQIPKEGRMKTTIADFLFIFVGYAALIAMAGMAARLMQP